jgi:hypothetical protein
MINMGQDTKDKAMEKHLRAMLWIVVRGGVKSLPKVVVGSVHGVQIGGKCGWCSSSRRESSPRHARQVQLFRGVATPLPLGDNGQSFVQVKPASQASPQELYMYDPGVDNNCNVAWGLDRPNPNAPWSPDRRTR